MKIAQVCPFFLPVVGGVGANVYHTSREFIEKGHEVHVFTSDSLKDGKRADKLEETIDGIHIHRCKHWFHLGKFASFWPDVYKKLMEGEFDVIHSHNLGQPHCFFAAMAAKKKKIPHFLTTHASFLGQGQRGPLGRMIASLNFHIFGRISLKNSHVISISEWEREHLKKLGVKKFEIIPNGVPESYFNRIKKNDFEKRHKVRDFILFIGRIEKRKGPDIILEVAEKMPERDFVIIGPDGGMADELRGEMRMNVRLLGRVGEEEKIKALQAAKIFLLPSRREGLPLSIIEAMAAGLPIVATSTDGIPYVVQEGENGFLTEYADVEKICKSIKLLENRENYKRISGNNTKKAKDYTWKKIAERLLELYKQ